MNKILLLLGSSIAACAFIMQMWVCIAVFNNSYLCRTGFSDANTSNINEINCKISLNSTEQWHCTCRVSASYYIAWMRIFDDASVTLASFLFIILVLIEFYRSFYTVQTICGEEIRNLTTLEFFSPSGFVALILNPSNLDNPIPSTYFESSVIVVDALSIGLIFQYCSASKTSIDEPFILIALISSCFDGIRCILNLYFLNCLRRIAKRKIHTRNDKKSNCNDPIFQKLSNYATLPTAPPAYVEQKSLV